MMSIWTEISLTFCMQLGSLVKEVQILGIASQESLRHEIQDNGDSRVFSKRLCLVFDKLVWVMENYSSWLIQSQFSLKQQIWQNYFLYVLSWQKKINNQINSWQLLLKWKARDNGTPSDCIFPKWIQPDNVIYNKIG